jgi:hypothetical protein
VVTIIIGATATIIVGSVGVTVAIAEETDLLVGR